MKEVIASIILGLCSFLGTAQHPILAQFSAQQIGGVVRIDFGIKGGASCVGVTLERRTEGEDFMEVGYISGICGGTSQTEWYAVDDVNPVSNTTNFYRLRLGQEGNSDELAFDFVYLGSDLLLFPNPVQDQLSLRWVNVSSTLRIIRIYASDGRLVSPDYTSNGYSALLDLSFLEDGLYHLVLQDEKGKVLSTKSFLKQTN